MCSIYNLKCCTGLIKDPLSVFFKYETGSCKFSNFGLILDFFTSALLKIIFENSSCEHVSHDFIIDLFPQLKLNQHFESSPLR